MNDEILRYLVTGLYNNQNPPPLPPLKKIQIHENFRTGDVALPQSQNVTRIPCNKVGHF